MAGGELQLSAKGAQDHILVGNPQISFFKSVFRRYTNFAMETMRLDSVGNDINKTNTSIINCHIKRNGDLLSKVYFNFEVPNIYSGASDDNVPYEFKWVENLGTSVFENARLIIGSSEIDKHDSNFFNIHSELRNNDTQKQTYNKLIGNLKELYDPTLETNQYFPIPIFDDNSFELTEAINTTNVYNVYRVPMNAQSTIGGLNTNSITLNTNELNVPDDFFTGMYLEIGTEINGCITAVNGNDITLDTNASETVDIYNGASIIIGNVVSTINGYTGNDRIATVDALSSGVNVGTPYKILPFKRKITGYTQATKIATFDAFADTPANTPNDALEYNIYRSLGEQMTVSIKKNGNNISEVHIINPGLGYIDNDKLFIDIDSQGPQYDSDNDPIFYLMYSKYPHTRQIDPSGLRNFQEQSNTIMSSVTPNSSFSSQKTSLIPSIKKRNIKVPMNFFFNKTHGMSLPLIALQYNEVYVEVLLRKNEDLFTVVSKTEEELTDNLRLTSFNRKKNTNVNITEFISDTNFRLKYFFEATYIFLDSDERRRFATSSHDYLIEQVQKQTIKNQSVSRRHEMLFNHPVKELIVVGQRSDINERNEWTNYTNWTNEHVVPYSFTNLTKERSYINSSNSIRTFYNKNLSLETTDTSRNFDMIYFRKHIIDSMELVYEGQVRERVKDHMYFNNQHPYDYHKTNPKDGINVYSFSLNPNESQPSGSCNFSRIQRFELLVDFGFETGVFQLPGTGGNSEYNYDITVYAISYNILKIVSGIANIQFAN